MMQGCSRTVTDLTLAQCAAAIWKAGSAQDVRQGRLDACASGRPRRELSFREPIMNGSQVPVPVVLPNRVLALANGGFWDRPESAGMAGKGLEAARPLCP